MKIIKQTNEIEIYKFRPRFFKLFHYKLFELTKREYIRYLLAKIRGSRIFYVLEKGNPIGLCLIEKGGGRYTFCSKDDIVIVPIYIKEEYRRKGWANMLINTIIEFEKKS